jgi:SAM-dependent methyltransferase
MGLSKAGLKIFLREAQRRPFSGRLLTLGRQDAHFDYAFVERAAREFGLGLKPPDHIELSHKPELAEAGRVSDRTLFRALGFSECLSTDYSDFEGADVVLDLNRPDTPEELRDRFDVVFDGGTMEHVFHVPNALAHICRSVRVGGRAIHMAPASNHVDHGFYMFSPTLFWDFYAANGFEIETCQIYRYWPEHNTEPWEVVDYTPGSLDRLSFGGLDDGLYGVLCVATRTEQSTADRVPQQRMYTDVWKGQRRARRPKPERGALQQWWRDSIKAFGRGAIHLVRTPLRRWRRRSLRKLGLEVRDRF